MTELATSNYKTLSFDCYGTLIDWEGGLLGYLQPLLQSHDVHVIDEWVLEFYAEAEPSIQAEGGSYRSVLTRAVAKFGKRLAFTPTESACAGLAASIEHWQPLSDSVEALAKLGEHFDLIALSNIDDDLFAYSSALLGNPFTRIITAQQVGFYKPHDRMFETLLEHAEGPVLHVAQSRFHDIVPATRFGLDTVWIDRPSLGAAKPVEAQPTWTFESMEAFAAAWRSS